MSEKTIRVAALNITTHPHSADRYVELLRAAKDNRVVAVARGDRSVLITQFRQPLTDDPTTYVGTLSSFVALDPHMPWLNIERGEKADPQELEQIRVPDSLKPDMKQALFVFAPSVHRLIFEDGTLGISVKETQKAVYVMLNDTRVLRELHGVNVSIEQDRATLDRILNMHKLTSLEIKITRPNPDDFGDADDDVEDRLKKQRVRTWYQKFTSDRGEGLAPDKTTVAEAQLAMSNGEVIARGTEAAKAKTKTISTVNHPDIYSSNYDPRAMTKDQGIVKVAKEFLRRFRKTQ